MEKNHGGSFLPGWSADERSPPTPSSPLPSYCSSPLLPSGQQPPSIKQTAITKREGTEEGGRIRKETFVFSLFFSPPPPMGNNNLVLLFLPMSTEPLAVLLASFPFLLRYHFWLLFGLRRAAAAAEAAEGEGGRNYDPPTPPRHRREGGGMALISLSAPPLGGEGE